MKSVKYLDLLMEKKGLTKDSELCRLIECTPSAISNYRKGTRIMENELCVRIALELGMDNPMPIIMAADIDRAERAGQRSLWEVFSKRMASSAAPASLFIFAALTAMTPSSGNAATLLHRAVSSFILC